ncbi:hypothetical protein BD779DRAFT_1536195 [Infundibulicybe gibba]|nr:hypothetical protein BD779DRAFT_1536195 [Infundibulicybe gibba]
MTAMRSTTSDLASISRAAQRKQRLLDIENEQRIEEAEALKMTEEQRQILYLSFKSVKVEFSDLDGLKWTGSALRRRKFQPPHASSSRGIVSPGVNSSVAQSPNTLSKPQAFAVLTNAELALFHPEDTIRASSRRTPQPQRSPTHTSSSDRSCPRSVSMNTSPPSHPAPTGLCNHRNGTRSRSPVKGLFANSCTTNTAEFPPSDGGIQNNCEDEDEDDDDTRTIRGESEYSDHHTADITITEDPGDSRSGGDNADSWDATHTVTRGRAQRPACQPQFPPGIPHPSTIPGLHPPLRT